MNPIRILSGAQIRALETFWIEHCHKDWGMVLMEIAGMGAASIIADLHSQAQGKVTVICGRGNNGGDGFVIARHLSNAGIPVSVFALPANSNSSSEMKTNSKLLQSLGIEVQTVAAADLEPVRQALSESTIVVDALLGTGLDRNVEGLTADLIKLINKSELYCVSVDIPSGVHADTGQIMGVAVQASLTVSFSCLKAGLLCFPGASLAGVIEVVDIGLPQPEFLDQELRRNLSFLDEPCWYLVTETEIRERLPLRHLDSHKGSFGLVLLVAGSCGMSGAAMMAAKSTLRSGAGLAVLASPISVVKTLAPEEVLYRGLQETDSGTISRAALPELETEIERAQVIVLGPGLSSNIETIKFVHEFFPRIEKPCVVDADALNALAQNTDVISSSKGDFIFTPHPKELSRLMGIPTETIQSNRLKYAQEAAAKFGATIVLKGAHTVVASVDGEAHIVTAGNSGMATAGAGDVLSGVIAGLLAQGLDTKWAAIAGAFIHASAGDIAADMKGEDGMIAQDIQESLPQAFKFIRQ